MKYCRITPFVCLLMLAITGAASAQNPVIRTMYSAHPSVRVFGNGVYLYILYDIPASETKILIPLSADEKILNYRYNFPAKESITW